MEPFWFKEGTTTLIVLTAILAFIVILSILVFVHELGHFVVAKRSGITVEEFAIGFPPRAVKVWQDEGKITLDGHEFIISRKTSVSRHIQPGAQVYAETTVDEKGRPVVTHLEIATAEDNKKDKHSEAGSEAKFFSFLDFDSRKTKSVSIDKTTPTVTVDEVIRPTEYSINWIPLGGYVRMVGEEDPSSPGSFASKSKRVRFAVLAAGSLMNLAAAIFFFTLAAMSGVPEPVMGINAQGEEAPVAQTLISEVVANTPADEAGLKADDIVLGVDGVEFNYVGDLIDYVNQHKGVEITLHVQRGEQIMDISLVPRIDPPPGQGSMGVGIRYEGLETKRDYNPLSEASVWGVTQTAQYVGLTLYLPVVALREMNLEESQKTIPSEAVRPTGPVGIFQQIAAAAEAALFSGWWFPVFWLTAILSTALAIFNLLPLPALDGGRIFFVLIEALRGKRIAPEKEGAIHFIGLALLLTLMLVITYYDVINPIPSIDWANLF